MLYLAYGMNTNIDQMASRCPGSVSIGRVDIPDYRLVFRGVADIEYSPGDTLQTVMWDITPACEDALDMLEGYPTFYTKKYLQVEIGRKSYEAMVYQMVGDRLDYSHPSSYYQQMLEEGYQDHGLDINQIYEAEGFCEVEDTLDWINRRYTNYSY
jgi:hypothetical protein